MKKVLIIGGSSGIGLSIVEEFMHNSTCEKVYVVDRTPFPINYDNSKIETYVFDLKSADYSIFAQFLDIDTLIITAGFGRLSLFKDISEQHIVDSFQVNTIAVIRIIKFFYNKLLSNKDFYCGVMGSIAGFMSSPFFAVYGASKAALKIFIESVNVELIKSGSNNRILNISPGSIKGTSFYNGDTHLDELRPLSLEIIKRLQNKDDLYIPKYDEIYKVVLQRYYDDFRKEGMHSYEYKENSNR